jgi:hypothetical protein
MAALILLYFMLRESRLRLKSWSPGISKAYLGELSFLCAMKMAMGFGWASKNYCPELMSTVWW